MKNNEPLNSPDMLNGTSRVAQRRRLSIVLIVVLTLGLLITCFLLPNSYASLRGAIQQERMDYVNEISNQIIASHRFMMEEFTSSVSRYAGSIDRSNATDMEDLASCFTPEDAENILLISDEGKITDLRGNMHFSTEQQLIDRLTRGEGVTQLFSSLNSEEDFWLFAAPINKLTLDGHTYNTVVLAVPSQRFNEALSIALFGQRGASYIIKTGGSIEIKPEGFSVAFGGYNLFSSLLHAGAPPEQVEALQKAVERRENGSLLAIIEDQEWLLGYNSINEENAIVVAIPLTLTAASTYEGMSNTLILMGTAIMLVALIAILLMLRFFARDKERHRLAMAAEAKSSFFSKMSHDIRTPLNAIIGLQTLIKDSNDINSIKEYNEQSATASAYLLSILNDVLDMARIESGGIPLNNEPFDMKELLDGVDAIVGGMAAEKELDFEIKKDGQYDTYYYGDEVRIRQVLVNLLNNAVKFTIPPGRVSLSVDHSREAEHDRFTMQVSDTGIGMSEEYLARVFTPFEQEKSSYTQQYSGSGLGLAIVHNLITQMGGAINVKSKLGEGSTFTVSLLLKRGETIDTARQRQKSDKEQLASYAGKCILLAEDNTINQIVAAKLLRQKFDADTELASDGAQAVQIFADSPVGHFSLILMDIKMPIMDGLTAAKTIRSLPREDAATVPIIALSANAYSYDVDLSLAAGMNDHLPKPIDIQALGAALAKYIK